jgi:pimeloyl-ACP methyl ester carboxylesterase
MALDLAFDSLGSGPPLVVLHGLFGSGGNWRSVARQLAEARTVYLVDLRNHGSSPWADTMGYAEMAEDVLQLIERQRLQRPAVLGHSVGGNIAMALALMHPQAVGQVVVADIAPVSYPDRLSPVADAMLAADVDSATSREQVRERLAARLPDAGVVAFLLGNLVARDGRWAWRVNLAVIRAAIAELIHFPQTLTGLRYQRPLQVIAGADSDYVTEPDGVEFRPMFPDARIEFIPAAGHWVHADQPQAFVAALQHALAPHADAVRP